MKASDALLVRFQVFLQLQKSYPDLKASGNFVNLQEELTNTENKISYSHVNSTTVLSATTM